MIPYQVIVLGAVVGIISIVIAVTNLTWRIRISKKPKPQLAAGKSVEPPPQGETKKRGTTLVQRIKWAWIIIIILIPFTWWVGGIIWRPTLNSMMNVGVKKVSATYGWKKLDYQYGYNPDQRYGSYRAVIVAMSEKEGLSFIVFSPNSKCYFYGRFVGEKNGRKKFKGRWRQDNPPSGGKWELEEDPNEPGVLKGIETDWSLPEGKPSELIILN